MDIEVTLLSKKDIKENEIIKKIGPACGHNYWTSTSIGFNCWADVCEFHVAKSGNLYQSNVRNVYGIRLVIKIDNINELIKNRQIKIENDIEIIEYGAYPNLFEEVDIINNNVLQETGKKYIIPSQEHIQFIFELIKCKEYEYNGEKLIKYYGTYYKIKPVEFYIDRKNNMLISKNVLFYSSVDLDYKNYDGTFEKSQLYNFLNHEFIKYLNPNMENDKTLEIEKTKGKTYIKTLFHNH